MKKKYLFIIFVFAIAVSRISLGVTDYRISVDSYSQEKFNFTQTNSTQKLLVECLPTQECKLKDKEWITYLEEILKKENSESIELISKCMKKILTIKTTKKDFSREINEITIKSLKYILSLPHNKFIRFNYVEIINLLFREQRLFSREETFVIFDFVERLIDTYYLPENKNDLLDLISNYFIKRIIWSNIQNVSFGLIKNYNQKTNPVHRRFKEWIKEIPLKIERYALIEKMFKIANEDDDYCAFVDEYLQGSFDEFVKNISADVHSVKRRKLDNDNLFEAKLEQIDENLDDSFKVLDQEEISAYNRRVEEMKLTTWDGYLKKMFIKELRNNKHIKHYKEQLSNSSSNDVIREIGPNIFTNILSNIHLDNYLYRDSVSQIFTSYENYFSDDKKDSSNLDILLPNIIVLLHRDSLYELHRNRNNIKYLKEYIKNVIARKMMPAQITQLTDYLKTISKI